jgi:hypothetical protein
MNRIAFIRHPDQHHVAGTPHPGVPTEAETCHEHHVQGIGVQRSLVIRRRQEHGGRRSGILNTSRNTMTKMHMKAGHGDGSREKMQEYWSLSRY